MGRLRYAVWPLSCVTRDGVLFRDLDCLIVSRPFFPVPFWAPFWEIGGGIFDGDYLVSCDEQGSAQPCRRSPRLLYEGYSVIDPGSLRCGLVIGCS